MAEKINPKTTPVRAYPHPSDSRANIPTAELESFARPEEKRPATVRYPRDPSLDPQLVWKGKDEQDGHDLEVPAVPIYIQETIDPLALIEELRAESEGRRSRAAAGLLRPVQRPDVRGEGRLLPSRRQLDQPDDPGRLAAGHDQPGREGGPEGQGPEDLRRPALRHQVRLELAGLARASATYATARPRTSRASPSRSAPIRDTWELGIHSYLSYLRDRLVVARELLTESGSIFVQIGDENVHLVRSVLDEVFGAENFVSHDHVREDDWRELAA